MREFQTAAMDGRTKILTIIFVLICLAVPFFLFYGIPDSEIPTLALFFPTLIVLAALVSSYFMIPKIFVGNQNIYIKNTFVNIKIPVKEVVGIKKFERVGLNIRTFGVGGLFGYFGYFNGNDVWYVTNIRKKVKIQTSKKLYVISPEEPEKFIEEINRIRQNFKL